MRSAKKERARRKMYYQLNKEWLKVRYQASYRANIEKRRATSRAYARRMAATRPKKKPGLPKRSASLEKCTPDMVEKKVDSLEKHTTKAEWKIAASLEDHITNTERTQVFSPESIITDTEGKMVVSPKSSTTETMEKKIVSPKCNITDTERKKTDSPEDWKKAFIWDNSIAAARKRVAWRAYSKEAVSPESSTTDTGGKKASPEDRTADTEGKKAVIWDVSTAEEKKWAACRAYSKARYAVNPESKKAASRAFYVVKKKTASMAWYNVFTEKLKANLEKQCAAALSNSTTDNEKLKVASLSNITDYSDKKSGFLTTYSDKKSSSQTAYSDMKSAPPTASSDKKAASPTAHSDKKSVSFRTAYSDKKSAPQTACSDKKSASLIACSDKKSASLTACSDKKSAPQTACSDKKSASLTACSDKKTASLTACSDKKTASLTACSDKKSASQTACSDKKSASLTACSDKKSASLIAYSDKKSASLTAYCKKKSKKSPSQTAYCKKKSSLTNDTAYSVKKKSATLARCTYSGMRKSVHRANYGADSELRKEVYQAEQAADLEGKRRAAARAYSKVARLGGCSPAIDVNLESERGLQRLYPEKQQQESGCLHHLRALSECNYNKMQFGVRNSSIAVCKQSVLHHYVNNTTSKEIHPGVPLSQERRDSEEFQASINACAAFLWRRASRNSSKGVESVNSVIHPSELDSFLIALDLQRLHPIVGQDQTSLSSSTSSTSRSHSQASKFEEDNITACSNSRQSAQLLTAPSHGDNFSTSVKRMSKEVNFQKVPDLEINSGTETILSSPSPLAARTSKACHNYCTDNKAAPTIISKLIDTLTSAPPIEVELLKSILLHGCSCDITATPTKVSRLFDPMASAPPIEDTVLGKRKTCLPPCRSNTSLFKKSRVGIGFPKKVVCMKAVPPHGEFLPVVHSRTGTGQLLSGTVSHARVGD